MALTPCEVATNLRDFGDRMKVQSRTIDKDINTVALEAVSDRFTDAQKVLLASINFIMSGLISHPTLRQDARI